MTAPIRKPEVTNSVFHVASISPIRNLMVKFQREYAHIDNIVMEGRDIGTVVFPKAQRKFYLDAKAIIRARRRKLELEQKGIEIDIEDIVKQIKDRDAKDKARKCGPLKKAEDAVYIDTSNMNIPEVVNCLFTYIKDEKKK